MFTHVIWDFDGTLFDTYPAMSAAFKDTLKSMRGVDEKIEDICELMKISMGRMFSAYTKRYNLNDAFFDAFNQLRLKYEISESKPYDGIACLCRYIHEHGAYNYLFTHRDLSSISLLENSGLLGFFSGFVTHSDGFASKPDPQGILYLAEKHLIPLNSAIMIGDREIDILSAKNANISSTLFSQRKECKTCADFVITDHNEMYAILGLE